MAPSTDFYRILPAEHEFRKKSKSVFLGREQGTIIGDGKKGVENKNQKA